MKDEFWTEETSFPEPRFPVNCPICGGGPVITRHFMHHCRPTSPQPFRVDVGLKCTHCAYLWYHGVRIEQEYFLGHGKVYDRRHILQGNTQMPTPIDRGVED